MTNLNSTTIVSCDARLNSLQAEFGQVLASRMVEAELVDFLWEGRVRERYLGQQDGVFAEAEELSRILVISRLDGYWYVALCLVDGEGEPAMLLWRHVAADAAEAEAFFSGAR